MMKEVGKKENEEEEDKLRSLDNVRTSKACLLQLQGWEENKTKPFVLKKNKVPEEEGKKKRPMSCAQSKTFLVLPEQILLTPHPAPYMSWISTSLRKLTGHSSLPNHRAW